MELFVEKKLETRSWNIPNASLHMLHGKWKLEFQGLQCALRDNADEVTCAVISLLELEIPLRVGLIIVNCNIFPWKFWFNFLGTKIGGGIFHIGLVMKALLLGNFSYCVYIPHFDLSEKAVLKRICISPILFLPAKLFPQHSAAFPELCCVWPGRLL